MSNAAAKTNNTKTDEDDIRLELQILRDDIARLTTTVTDYGKTQGEQLKSYAKTRAREAKAKGKEAADHAVRRVEDQYHEAEAAIRDNPGAAVGIAAGVGFIIGMLMTRRS